MNKWTDPEFDMPSAMPEGNRWELEHPECETTKILYRVKYLRWDESNNNWEPSPF
jgi:hypothetical protein